MLCCAWPSMALPKAPQYSSLKEESGLRRIGSFGFREIGRRSRSSRSSRSSPKRSQEAKVARLKCLIRVICSMSIHRNSVYLVFQCVSLVDLSHGFKWVDSDCFVFHLVTILWLGGQCLHSKERWRLPGCGWYAVQSCSLRSARTRTRHYAHTCP